jgi:uncharacterized protein (TIGR00106 family)
MVLLEFAMAPAGKGESMSPYVARIVDLIDQSGLPYQLTPMGTILEGDYDAVMAVVATCFRELQRDCSRIAMNLKMDYREGPAGRLQAKTASVQRKVGRALKT